MYLLLTFLVCVRVLLVKRYICSLGPRPGVPPLLSVWGNFHQICWSPGTLVTCLLEGHGREIWCLAYAGWSDQKKLATFSGILSTSVISSYCEMLLITFKSWHHQVGSDGGRGILKGWQKSSSHCTKFISASVQVTQEQLEPEAEAVMSDCEFCPLPDIADIMKSQNL